MGFFCTQGNCNCDEKAPLSESEIEGEELECVGCGAWKDYVNDSGELLMTLKLTGDDPTELQEIYDAFILWAEAQSRFDGMDSLVGGDLFTGKTNFWISKDQSSIRIVLSQNLDLLNSISNQLKNF